MSADAWSQRIEAAEAEIIPRRLQEDENVKLVAHRAHLGHLVLPSLTAGVLTGAFLGMKGRPIRAIMLGALRGVTAVAAAQFTWMSLGSSPSYSHSSTSLYAAPASAAVLSFIALIPSPLALVLGITCASAVASAGGAAMWRVGQRLSHVHDGAQNQLHSVNRH